MQENIDFSFVCKYCNKLYEISLSDLDREIIDLILKVKLNQSKNLAKSVINNNLSTSQSTIFSENPQSMDDMDAVKKRIIRKSGAVLWPRSVSPSLPC